jgi:hypothetical protein
MKNFKAKEVRESVLEHLIHIGYKSEYELDFLADSPYIIALEDKLLPQSSVSLYKDTECDELNEVQLLKLQPQLEVEKEDIVFLVANKLVKYLNSNKIVSSNGYDQIFTVQRPWNEMLVRKWEVLPISPNACGSISSKKMRIIMDWLEKNASHVNYNFSYTDYDDCKKKYGTSRPCLCLH